MTLTEWMTGVAPIMVPLLMNLIEIRGLRKELSRVWLTVNERHVDKIARIESLEERVLVLERRT